MRIGSVDIAYDERGAGEPLLLIPGLSMARAMWPEALIDALAGAGFRVVSMDNRDAGASTRIAARAPDVRTSLLRSLAGLSVRTPYQLEDMAEDAFGLMSALGHERFHVVGASMGGMIAQTMALGRPERLATLTSIMSSPGGRRYSIGKPHALRTLLQPVPRARAEYIEQLVARFRVLAGGDGALPFDEPHARYVAAAQVESGITPSQVARQLVAIFESSNRRLPRIAAITTPTLVIHGACDPLLPLRGARAMAQRIPRAELLVVRGMGHNLPAPVLPLLAGAITTHARTAALIAARAARPAITP